jgi:hypothetical protein
MPERKQFVAQFHSERTIHAERSIIQSLAIMNSNFVAKLTDPSYNRTLGAVADAPFLDTRAKIDTLFLAVLGRLPTDSQAAHMAQHVSQGDPRQTLGDVFWVLINSTEFHTNH